MTEEIEMKATEKASEDKKSSGVMVISTKFGKEDKLSSERFEVDKRNRVVNWGEDNLLPDYLIRVAKLKSTKHSAIVSRKCKMIAGNGFESSESAAVNEFLQNEKGKETLDAIAKRVTADYEILNMFALGVRWNIDKTRIAAIDYIPAHKVRVSTQPNVYKVSDNWIEPKKKGSNTQIKQAFNTNPLPEGFEELTDKEKKFELNQILVVKNMQIASETYPAPTYAAGLNWILSDAGISSFTLGIIKKNFTGGYHINIATGIPEADERKKFKRDFKNEYAGEEGESIIITFSEPEAANVPELKPLPSTGNEDIYNETEKRAQENIFIVHEVTNPALFGIRIPGELGNTSKGALQESLEIFQKVYVDQRQNDIETPFNMLFKINNAGLEEQLKLSVFSLEVDEGEDSENAEGKKLAKSISKLPDNLQQKVLDNLSRSQILSLAGIKEEAEPSSEVNEVEPTNTEENAV